MGDARFNDIIQEMKKEIVVAEEVVTFSNDKVTLID